MSVNPGLWERAAEYLKTLSISRGHAGSGDKNFSNTSKRRICPLSVHPHLAIPADLAIQRKRQLEIEEHQVAEARSHTNHTRVDVESECLSEVECGCDVVEDVILRRFPGIVYNVVSVTASLTVYMSPQAALPKSL